MATLAATRPTMIDLAQVSHNGQIMDIVYPLTESQDILKDAVWYEANDLSSHTVSRNVALVAGVWREINQGFSASKGIQSPAREAIGGIESRLEVDVKELKMAASREGFLAIQDYSHMEGLSQDFADAIVRGDLGTNAASFNGFHTRYNSLSETDDKGRLICQEYSGTGSDTMSILAIQWGPGQVYMVHPRGDQDNMGIQRIPVGVERVTDRDGNAYYAYVVRYEWNGGLVVEDERCYRRICNIEASGTTNNLQDSSNHGYVGPLIDALLSMKNQGRGAHLYMNIETYGQLWKAANDKVTTGDKDNIWKAPRLSFNEHTIGITDSLLLTETAVA